MTTPEQRRMWVRHVLGSGDLTAAHKVVLLALETFADYRDGTNAHPGEALLAETCGLKPRAVRYALDRGQELKLIERTALANPRRGLANVYRLVTTGTAVPVEPVTTGTAVPVEPVTTGTAVPVEPVTTGTAVHHHRHGHDSTTGMAVPPTFQVPSNHQEGSPHRGTSPNDEPTMERPPPSNPQSANSKWVHGPYGPRCPKHVNDAYPPSCFGCGDAREAAKAAAAEVEQREADRRAEVRHAIDSCRDCDQYGRLDDQSDCQRHENFRTRQAAAS